MACVGLCVGLRNRAGDRRFPPLAGALLPRLREFPRSRPVW